MNSLFLPGVIFIVVISFVLSIIAIGLYNGLIALKENIKNAWANIDVVLKQRFDEITALVDICRQYVEYEEDMIEKIMAAKEKMVHGKTHEEQMEGSIQASLGVKGLLAIGESFPELKANENFLNIQNRLSTLEETLADRREFYNSSVTIYNTRIQQIPHVFVASMLNYTSEVLFEVDQREKKMPQLKIRN